MRRTLVAVATVTTAAALYTGARTGRFFVDMKGVLPPHYGYSAYFACVLVFLGPTWARYGAVAALLLSGNRAAWVGAIAGWAYLGGRRRIAAAALLCVLATIGGLAVKPPDSRARNDSARVIIWKAVGRTIQRHPDGIGPGALALGVEGYEVNHAHSDLLEIAVVWGFQRAVLVVILAAYGFWLLPRSPEKALLVALTTTSILDNRLTTHSACLALYLVVWATAFGRIARRE